MGHSASAVHSPCLDGLTPMRWNGESQARMAYIQLLIYFLLISSIRYTEEYIPRTPII